MKATCVWYADVARGGWRCAMHRGFHRGASLTLAHPCPKVRKNLSPEHVRRVYERAERKRAEWNAFAAAREAQANP